MTADDTAGRRRHPLATRTALGVTAIVVGAFVVHLPGFVHQLFDSDEGAIAISVERHEIVAGVDARQQRAKRGVGHPGDVTGDVGIRFLPPPSQFAGVGGPPAK